MSDTSPFSAPDSFRSALDLSPEFAAHLAAEHSRLSAFLMPRVAPYHAALRLAGTRLELAGDEAAVRVLQNVILAAGAAWTESADAEAAWAPGRVAEAIADTLQRDLAFRVAGLRQAVRPRSMMQHAFMAALLDREPPVLIAAGPTGTGKSHLALAAGIDMLNEGRYKHLVIARPGGAHAPGDTPDTSFDPHYAAIRDELHDLVGADEVRSLKTAHRLEIMPVSHMRGRTFQNTFVIIDEAQDMSVPTTRMAVTRLGQNARIVLTGDPSYVELGPGETSGMAHLMELVEDAPIARVFRFTAAQIIRAPVVAALEALYEKP
ncbi:PhoH family protein [Maricaulis sp. CAU 1757]